jgi:transcriptional antiterminator
MEVWQMTNLFLKINKDLFKLGLNPTELIILAQIMEFDTNNKVCYMTNEQFAEMLNVSERTVSRALNDTLQSKGYITIINPKSKSRSFQLNKSIIEEDVRQIVLEEKKHRQNVVDNIDNLSNEHRQNDFIKDNVKDKVKDKDVINQPQVADCITLANAPKGKVEVVSEVMKDSTTQENRFKF